ncbi:MAG: DUF4276 family protein [Candidatus Sumerlaeota bacterium]|nr:DUF4276 family protein [Candidatus Sumerlaeota bacterium]
MSIAASDDAHNSDSTSDPRAGDALPAWRFHRFFLIVTGKTEESHLPDLFRSLHASQSCLFKVLRRIQQSSPKSPKRNISVVGRKNEPPPKILKEISLPVRKQLRSFPECFIILIDDLEHNRRGQIQAVFDHYHEAMTHLLNDSQKRNVSVHFLVPMLEAYFLADAKAVNQALGTTIQDYAGDVEDIRNPKGEIKDVFPTYQEIEDGGKILQALDAAHVLSRAETCAYLRTLFAWCIRKMGGQFTDQYRLKDGKYAEITRTQISM